MHFVSYFKSEIKLGEFHQHLGFDSSGSSLTMEGGRQIAGTFSTATTAIATVC
jgi:hypothetical protein